jgi:hypothetical protein
MLLLLAVFKPEVYRQFVKTDMLRYSTANNKAQRKR